MPKLTKEEMLMGIGAVIAVISAFLPWYSVSFMGHRASANGLTSWWSLSFIAALLLIASIVPQVKSAIPQMEEKGKVIQIVLAAIVTLIPVLAILSSPPGMNMVGASISVGVWGAIIGGAVALFGGVTQKKEAVQPMAQETTEIPPEDQSTSSE